MATATRAMGRERQAFGRSLVRSRASSQNPSGHQRVANTGHANQRNVTMLQAVLIAKINRKPCRLETTVTQTKQTLATHINRKLSATSRITNRSIPNRHTSHRAPSVTNHASPIAATLLDTNGHFRRNNNSPNSFKTNGRVNSYSIQTAAKRTTTADTNHESRITSHESQVSRVTNHYSPLTNHASPPLVIYSSHTPNPRSSCK